MGLFPLVEISILYTGRQAGRSEDTARICGKPVTPCHYMICASVHYNLVLLAIRGWDIEVYEADSESVALITKNPSPYLARG
jgi:hypothetical protein